MKYDTKQLEKGALQYARKELSDLAIAANFVGNDNLTFYFEPKYRPSLISSTGDIHLITFRNGVYGVTFSREEIDRVNASLF